MSMYIIALKIRKEGMDPPLPWIKNDRETTSCDENCCQPAL